MNLTPYKIETNLEEAAKRIPIEHTISTSNLPVPPMLKIPSTDKIQNLVDNIHNNTTIPQKHDVICGKEKGHEGNRRFRKFIDLYREQYHQSTTKHKKMTITKEIYTKLKHSMGSRFLRYNNKTNAWDEISEIVARDKISHALRYACSKQKEQAQPQQQDDNKKQQLLQKKGDDTSIDYDEKKILENSSISSSSLSGLSSRAYHLTTTTLLLPGAAKPNPVSTILSHSTRIKDDNNTIINPVMRCPMRRCKSDPLPRGSNNDDTNMWNQFVEQQQNLMRSMIEQEERRPVEASSDVKDVSTFTGQDRSRLMKIIDERPDLLMKGPLLHIDEDSIDSSSLQFDERDFGECTDTLF